MSKENLIPFHKRTESELREFTSRGGIKSGEIRRKKRDHKNMISSAMELMTRKKIRDLEKDLAKETNEDLKLLTEDHIEILKEGGYEMLKILEILENPKVSTMTKVIAINTLFIHEFGKPKVSETLIAHWGSGIGKSPAFTEENILLGIKHGIAKLNITSLRKAKEMIDLKIQLLE